MTQSLVKIFFCFLLSYTLNLSASGQYEEQVEKYLELRMDSVSVLLQDSTMEIDSNKDLISGTFSSSFTNDTIKPIRIILAKIERGDSLNSLPNWKVDAAFSICSRMSPKIEFITEKERRDFRNKYLISEEAGSNFMLYYDSLNAHYAAILRINKIENILGVNLTLQSAIDSIPILNGQGWAEIRYKESEGGKDVIDPTLLQGLQRAMARAFGDSLYWADLDSSLRVFPHSTIVVGGLKYINNDKLRPWNLFDEEITSAYDATETMYRELRSSGKFVCYDIATRDSLYSLNKMYGVENYDAPTQFEIKVLFDFKVQYYITGEFEHLPEGGRLKIYFCRIGQNGINIINSLEKILKEDDKEQYRKLLRQMISELIKDYH